MSLVNFRIFFLGFFILLIASSLISINTIAGQHQLQNKSNFTINENSPPIPIGKWNIVSNGLPGILNISSLNLQGLLNGSISIYPDEKIDPINGYYDTNSGKITFIRILSSNFTNIEIYTGYVFSNTIRDCLSGTGAGSCYQYAEMAGTIQSFADNRTNNMHSFLSHPNAERNTFGWYASHEPLPCIACPG